jgi:hypothetical protein
MIHGLKSALICTAAIALFGFGSSAAKADDPKEFKTEKGKSIALAHFVNPQSDCSSNPGPAPLPALRERPTNGFILLHILVTDVAATDSCPARKVPSIAVVYTPRPDFVGTDSVQIEVETGPNKITSLSCRITVQATDDKR